MLREKLRKSKKKSKKQKKEDKSNIVDCVDEECGTQRSEEFEPDFVDKQKEKRSLKSVQNKKTAKRVHIALLPDRYEPLEEEQVSDPVREQSSTRKQKKYTKIRKNIGKAIRYSWKCLVVGLQDLSSAYAGPLSVAVVLVPENQRPRA